MNNPNEITGKYTTPPLPLSKAYDRFLFQNIAFFFFYLILFVGAYYLLSYFGSPLEFDSQQLQLSHLLVLTIYLHIIGALFISRKTIGRFIIEFFSEAVSPYNLAFFRIVYYSMLVLLYNYQYYHLFPNYDGQSTLIPLPFTSWYLPFIPLSPILFKILYYSGSIVAIVCAIGFANKYIGWLNVLFSFYLIGVPNFFLGKVQYMHVWFWISSFLAFAPCSDVLSVDWVLKKWQNALPEYTPHLKYGIALKFLWLHFGIIYFFSAMGKLKLTGLNWALDSSMIYQIQLEWLQHYYNNIPKLRLDHYPRIAAAGGLSILSLELIFIFVVFSRKFRWLAAVSGICFHQLAGYFMSLPFPDLQCFYSSFINVGVLKKNTNAAFKLNSLKNSFQQDWRLRCVTIIGCFYFLVNSVFGFFNIPSWPFSCYPAHNAHVAATFKRVQFEMLTEGLDWIRMDSIGNKNNLDKDNYFFLDDKILQAEERNDTLSRKKYLRVLWRVWQNYNPELKKFPHPKAFIVETSLNPNLRHVLIQKKEIGY